MTRLAELPQHLGTRLTGQYLLTHCDDKLSQQGVAYKRLVLEDHSGTQVAHIWGGLAGLIEQTPDTLPYPVEVELSLRSFKHWAAADVQRLTPLAASSVNNAAALLPLSLCPRVAKDALDKLVTMVNWLSLPRLREFVNRVLLDSRIKPFLLTCKASQRYHHSYRGGLLTHSVDVMHLAARLAAETALTRDELELTVVGAFLHDIGKVRTVGDSDNRPVSYRVVRHETQNNRLLEPHLSWLRQQDPLAATVLDYTFDQFSLPATKRARPRFIGVDFILAADQVSAAKDGRKSLADFIQWAMPELTGQWATQPTG